MGIVLISLVSEFYWQLAYNLALSLKKNSGIPITLLTDKIQGKDDPFDQIIEVKKPHYFEGYFFNPFKAKTHIYDYSPYEQTLYLDVDTIFLWKHWSLSDVLRGLEGFQMHEVKRWSKENAHRCKIVWLKHVNLTVEHWNQAYGVDYPFVEYNSSFIYFDKSEKNKSYFDKLKKNYLNRKTKYRKIGGKYPDELAHTLTTAQLKHYSTIPGYRPIYFQWENPKMDLNKAYKKYPFLGLAGGGSGVKLVSKYNVLASQLDSPYHDFDNKKKIFHEG